MAEALGVDARTVRRGKADLRAAGLLTWEQRGYHRTPIYRLLWDRLVQLAASIKTRVTAACHAARKAATKAKPSTPPPSPPPLNKSPENGTVRPSGRTFSPAYPTYEGYKKRAWEGKGSAPAAPLRTQITEQELDARASSRFWKALQALGPQMMAQFIAHPSADELQAAAIRAERFKPDHGRTGLNLLAARLREMGA